MQLIIRRNTMQFRENRLPQLIVMEIIREGSQAAVALKKKEKDNKS